LKSDISRLHQPPKIVFKSNRLISSSENGFPLHDSRPDRNEDELDKICSISGYGSTGTGITGAVKYDDKKRAGSNKIMEVTDHLLKCDMSRQNPTSLEFLIAHGDSGGGLFIDKKLAGINSFVASDDKPDSSFGDESCHTRVCKYKIWLEENMK
jgi:hypothetical protein